MFHFELRQFPHTACRFNQSEQQLRAIMLPWVNQEWVEQGERKWNINEAKLTILQGPELTLPDLAMGRGWRNAKRRSEDVTERMLGVVRGKPAQAAAGEGSPELDLLADSLALELLGLLDDRAVALTDLWALAHARLDAPSPSQSLALAEHALRSLLRRQLVLLLRGDGDRDRRGEAIAGEEQETALGAIDAWTGRSSEPVVVARKG